MPKDKPPKDDRPKDKRSKGKRPHPPAPAEVAAALTAALQERTLVALGRDIPGSEALLGYVVGIAGEAEGWALIAVLDERLHLDGWSAVRLADVLAVAEIGGPESFPSLALVARGYWPPFAPDGVALGSAGDLLTSTAALAPLVSVFREDRDPETVWIGTVTEVGPKKARLLRIDEDAEWEDEPAKVRLADITRIEFGGQYEAALLEVGGAAPVPEPAAAQDDHAGTFVEESPASVDEQVSQGGW